jgi:SAM-dependent methyltransferase
VIVDPTPRCCLLDRGAIQHKALRLFSPRNLAFHLRGLRQWQGRKPELRETAARATNLQMSTLQSRISQVWNQKTVGPTKLHWSRVPQIAKHVSVKFDPSVTKIGKEGALTGFAQRLARLAKDQPFARAISIGCGFARHERYLLGQNIVTHFDLFDLAEGRLKKAKLLYAQHGVLDRATFSATDPFHENHEARYDLVFWKSALHHMMSAQHAVEWSWRALKPNGIFAMWDFVGPTRFQWSMRNLHYLNAFRSALPERFFRRGDDPSKFYRTTVRRRSIAEMIAADPSEAADSANIIPSVLIYFPNAKIVPLGGAIYCNLGGVLDNISADPDADMILQHALQIDDLLLELGEYHLAACIVRKD